MKGVKRLLRTSDLDMRGQAEATTNETWFPLVALVATQLSRYGRKSPNNHVHQACTAVSSNGEEKHGSATPAGRKSVEGGGDIRMISWSTTTLSANGMHLIRASWSSNNPEHTSVNPPYRP